MIIFKEQVGRVTILRVKGVVDGQQGASFLRDMIGMYLNSSQRNILLDLEDVSHMDLPGFYEISAAREVARHVGGDIKLLRVPTGIQGVLKIQGPFDAFTEEDEAISSFH